MERLYIAKTEFSPEINFSPEEHTFTLRGNSRPEDVREIYLPIITWLNKYRQFLQNSTIEYYSEENPMIIEFDLGYFNSSSAKFLYDIMQIMKDYSKSGFPVSVAWCYEEEDIDMKEAGEDLAFLAEIDIIFFKKPSK